jgi:hypothetical protein
MQPIYTEYGTKTRIEPTEATGIYFLLYLLYVLNISSKHLAAVITVPRHLNVLVIAVHLCCKKGTEVLGVQSILLWLSEYVL